MKMIQERKGFTLTELLVVIAVMGILAAIAIPAYVGQQKKAKKSEAKTNIQALSVLLEEYFADNGTYRPQPSNAAVVNYAEAADGTIITDTIRTDAGGGPYLQGFRPKASAAGTSVLYGYQIQFFANPRNYQITATPDKQHSPHHPPLAMDQDGTKFCADGSPAGECW